MTGHSSVGWVDIVVILAYLFATGYLGWLGYRGTRSAADFLVGGRSAHPIIMAVSYGATFISTAAIVGFGGVAGLFGMSLLWLTVLNIGFGILIAFIFLGEPHGDSAIISAPTPFPSCWVDVTRVAGSRSSPVRSSFSSCRSTRPRS